ncbi:NUDIX hydrolase [Sediminibacterium ginsengisoli]|uniref:ADP-ribose pyrophosphatase YjhB, NUDIX family n=1 Tax=Sediminibacterium ginsengisoli TaxID=413434 RepID=A0A1T4P900_9BACT|nr:NUDIX domain-containing protein [Sediminibacterium ginsengisoli]SJZ88055.1 ADP-ribose pyrophosphatase YjhB, NUDIX family [Sediminibacterium ginsengisoli]
MQTTKITAAGGLVLNDDGALLMIFRRGKWDLPKGKLDTGETIEACAVREVMEETGLQEVHIESAAGTTYHDYFDTYLQQDVTKETFWYKMHAPGQQQLVPQLEEDITEIRWIERTGLEKCLANSYANVVQIVRSTLSL